MLNSDRDVRPTSVHNKRRRVRRRFCVEAKQRRISFRLALLRLWKSFLTSFHAFASSTIARRAWIDDLG